MEEAIRLSKSKAAIFSPLIVIVIGFISAYIFQTLMQEWAFIPLALVYWGVMFMVTYKYLGRAGIAGLFAKPERNILWSILCFAVGFIPLPIFLMNLGLFTAPMVIALWLIFAIINPFFEEIYWRGFLLDALPFPKGLSVIYSTILFIASHPLMWGVFSIANRSWMTWASLLLMGVVWSVTRLKTKSLRWSVISHFCVDVFNLSVFVFLNLYVPPVM